MAIINLPSFVYWDNIPKLQLQRGGLSMRSRYTAKRQVVTFPFAMWIFEGELIKLDGAEAGQWRRFLSQLQGEKNTFRLPVPGVDQGPISGYLTNNIAVGTGGAAARSLSVPITATASKLILSEGDYFTLNDELKIATAPCNTSAGGTATLAFEPALRKPVTAGMAITANPPTILLCAADTNQANWSLERPVRHSIKLQAVEAIE